jgi:hypothetical protein
MPCITLPFDPAVGPLLNIGIAPAAALVSAQQGAPLDVTACVALIDSGASITCVSAALAARVGLKLLGMRPVAHAQGMTAANLYLADVALPFGDISKGVAVATMPIQSIQVMEFQPNSAPFEALLGRDIICMGLLTIIGYDRRFTICM